jgi:hypothetical protein
VIAINHYMHCIILHYMNCIICIALYALHYMHYIICIASYALHYMHCIICIAFYAFTALYALHSMYSWHYMHCILCILGIHILHHAFNFYASRSFDLDLCIFNLCIFFMYFLSCLMYVNLCIISYASHHTIDYTFSSYHFKIYNFI